MFQSSLRGIHDDEQLSFILEDWKYISKHGLTIWLRLLQERQLWSECECMADEVRAINVSKLPTGDKWLFPSIMPDPECPGHYIHDSTAAVNNFSIQQP